MTKAIPLKMSNYQDAGGLKKYLHLNIVTVTLLCPCVPLSDSSFYPLNVRQKTKLTHCSHSKIKVHILKYHSVISTTYSKL